MAAFNNNNARNVITGTAGDDTFLIVSGTTGAGNDVFDGLGGNDFAQGGTGNDRLVGGDGRDWLDGGDGDDTIRGGTGDDTINGGTGNDRLFGEDGNDSIVGGAGGAGALLDGGAGNDTLRGGTAGDTLIGGAGDDRIEAGDGMIARGGAGNDTIVAAARGSATLEGGAGADVLAILGAVNNLNVDLGTATAVSGRDFLGNAFNHTISGFTGVWSGAGNDQLRGTGAANWFEGGQGNDRIWGLGGADQIVGGLGRDILRGGGGNDVFIETNDSRADGGDTYFGGAGRDTFRFFRAENSPASDPDTIADFTERVDAIDLRNLATVAGSFGVIAWMGAAAFTGTGPQARFAAGRLEIDTTGNGAADFALLMPGVAALTPGREGDILL